MAIVELEWGCGIVPDRDDRSSCRLTRLRTVADVRHQRRSALRAKHLGFQIDLSQDLLELLGGRMTFTTFPEFPIHQVPRTVGAVTTLCHGAYLVGFSTFRLPQA
jgi:hypothetical protein